MRGFFCVVEGIDGSGKSTLIEALDLRLRDFVQSGAFSGYERLREPTDGSCGRRIREHLRNRDDLDRNAWLELFLLDRAENVERNVKPALNDGRLILQDRYFYSTAAYQGFADNPPTPADVVAVSLGCGFPVPDLVLYLDLAPNLALQRIVTNRAGTESFETLEQLQRIHANYASILPGVTVKLDAAQTPQAVCDAAYAAVIAAVDHRSRPA